MKTRVTAVVAGFLFIAACAGPQPTTDREIAPSARLACARLPAVPGSHGAYGGFQRDRHPYYLAEKSRSERQPAFVDPYFRPGEELRQDEYRSCLLGQRR